MHKLITFLKNQKILSIASHNEQDVWIANVYFGTNDKGILYFISSTESKHGKMILDNSNIAFSSSWFDNTNHANRKGVQGLGVCRLADGDEISTGLQLHNENFPEFKETITEEWIKNNMENSKVWIVIPTYIKYWDDELYGENESEEFTLS